MQNEEYEDPREYSEANKFNPNAYLHAFYTDSDSDTAMKLVHRLLPNVVARLPPNLRVLDIGSGPTIHVPVCFRECASEFYASDFSEDNRMFLRKWVETGQLDFDWSTVLSFIRTMEGKTDNVQEMIENARRIMRDVLRCDVYARQVIDRTELAPFDCVTTFYCIEASCTAIEQYRTNLANVLSLLRPGGYLIMAGVLLSDSYQFDGHQVAMCYLSEEELFNALESNNMDMDKGNTIYFQHSDCFMILCQKREQ